MNLLRNLNVEMEEFEIIAKYLCVVSLRFDWEDEFFVLPIISVKFSHVELLVADFRINQYIKEDKKVFIKFFRFAFEFTADAKIYSFNSQNNVLQINLSKIKRIRNYRQFLRYDVNLNAKIILDNERKSSFDVIVKDISQDGASIKLTDQIIKSGQFVNMEVYFENNTINIPSKILREISGEYNYTGVEFGLLNEQIYDNFIKELRAIEKDHLLSLVSMREIMNKTKKHNKKIVIYSINCDVIYYFVGLTILLGIENYDVFSNFRMLKKYINQSKPDAILIEISKINDDVLCVLKYIREKLKGVPLILIPPYIFLDQFKIYEKEIGNAHILEKPTSISQFEECLKKLGVIN